MSDDDRDDPWTDPARPPAWGENQVNHGSQVWSTWLRDSGGDLIPRPHIWHWCDRSVQNARIRVEHREPIGPDADPGWSLAGTGAHDMPSRDPLTLSPSLLLSDCCGLHGFLTDGVWRSV